MAGGVGDMDLEDLMDDPENPDYTIAGFAYGEDETRRTRRTTKRFQVLTLTKKPMIHLWSLRIYHLLQSCHAKTTYTYPIPIPIVSSITQPRRREKKSETETETETETEYKWLCSIKEISGGAVISGGEVISGGADISGEAAFENSRRSCIRRAFLKYRLLAIKLCLL
jgi:hypothetical protein